MELHLAVRDQLEGIRNGDDAEQLRERLQILPTEIEEVYGHMLHGIDKVYRKEVARYIRSVLDVEDGWSLFEFALAEHKSIDDILLLSKEISIWDICEHCTWVGERIAATCKGFLEVRERQQDEAESFGKLLEDRNIPLEQCEELRKMEFLHRCTQIGFLHRTAFDFFKDNEQGQDFLNIHTTTSTHPQVLYVKALLAKLRTFPLSTDKRQIRESIRSIMENASVAEEATGVAQLALMDLVNRSIILLWDRSLGQPSNIHWCKVWAKPLHSSMRNQHVIFKFVKRLRANIPFNHQFSVCQPVDFLGLAAWYGLDKYVLHMLDLQSRKWESGTENYLLSCSVGSLSEANALVSKLKLIAALLKRGADPNMGIPKGTVWGLFLKMLHHFHSDESLQNFEMTKTYWSNTSKAFLERGANAHEKTYSFVRDHDYGRHYLEISPLVKLFGSMIELHLSARSVLQQCFAKDAKFLEVEDPLIAAGATLYSKCSDVILGVSYGEMPKWIDPKPSRQQLSQIANLCEQGLLPRGTLSRQVLEIFEKADFKQLFEQAPTMDELRDLLHGEGSDEERPGTDTDRTTDSSSIDAPASSTDEEEGSFYSAHSSQQGED